MGRNKALIDVEGAPLWRRQFELLAQAGATERFISLRSEDDWAPVEVSRVFDKGVSGPLGGLLATTEIAAPSCTHLIAVAVDLPELPVSWLRGLGLECAKGRGAVGWRADVEAYEPLAAIYPRELFSSIREAVTRGEFSLQTLVSSAAAAGLLEVRTILPEEQKWFTNWNRPEDVVQK